MDIGIFQVSGANFYAQLFNDYEEGAFEVPSGSKSVGVIIKPVPGAPESCVL